MCPLAHHEYDFTHIINLKNLSIDGGLIEFINVNSVTLRTLKLKNLHIGRNKVSYRNGFNRMLSEAENLECLELDDCPEDFIVTVSNLHHISLNPTNTDNHTIAELLSAFEYSLRTIHLNMYGGGLTSLLTYMKFNNLVFEKVNTLIFHLDTIDSPPQKEDRHTLPLSSLVFPNLKRIIFGITETEQLKRYHKYCIYKGIKNVILKPYSPILPNVNTEDFKNVLNELNVKYRGHHVFTFINEDVSAQIDS